MIRVNILAVLLGLVCAASGAARAEGAYAMVNGPKGPIKAPLFDAQYDELAVAKVDDRPITLRELSDVLAVAHGQQTGAASNADFKPVLDRLIGTRLIAADAKEMGLDELPEVKEALARFDEMNLKELLQARVTRDVQEDPKLAEALYREMVREWKIRSVLFAKEEDAKAFAAKVKGGKRFDALADKAIAAKKAQGQPKGEFLSRKQQAYPQVIKAVEHLAVNAVAGPVRVPQGYTVLHLEAVRYPEDAKARDDANVEAFGRKRAEAVKKAWKGLVDKYVKVDEDLFGKLDFEADKPGFAALEKDERVLARVQGEKPITVAELAGSLRTIFFHGIEQAAKEKKLNPKKPFALDSLISRRVIHVESLRLGLDKSPEHLRAMQKERDSLLFSTWVDKVVLPDVKVRDSEGRKYYEQHKVDYTYPAFYTLATIGFGTDAAAQAAYEKVKSGVEFRWLKANAAGRIPEDKQELALDGATLTGRSLPDTVAKALESAKAGDLRVVTVGEHHYLVSVKAVTPAKPQPYEEVREDILPKVHGDNVRLAVEAMIAKLRKARKVQVFITQIGI